MKHFRTTREFLASNERVGFLHEHDDWINPKLTILAKTQAELDEAIKTCERLKREWVDDDK
jgi:hypothetical protein